MSGLHATEYGVDNNSNCASRCRPTFMDLDNKFTTKQCNIYLQLSMQGAIQVFSNAHFGQGSGPINLDEVSCTGIEVSLLECNHSGIGNHNCDHTEDASVRCQPNGKLKLELVLSCVACHISEMRLL